MIIRFRVLLDTEKDVFRDIAIEDSMTFFELHECILDAFEWQGDQMASFYESNEEWDKGNEIPLMDIQEEFGPEKKKVMSEVALSEIIKEPGQKLLYVFDFMLMWCFYVDVVGIGEAEKGLEYPQLMMSVGNPPPQHEKEPVDFSGPEDDENTPSEEEDVNYDDYNDL